MNTFLRRLTYRSELKMMARVLGLRRILREQYFRWARPADGTLTFGVGRIAGRFHVRTPSELRNLDPAGGAQHELHLLERLIAEMRPGHVVYDIGANVGLYAVLLAKAVGEQGRVIAFEPDSESYQHLQENLKLNGLTNVRTLRKALGEQTSKSMLYRGEGNADSSLVRSATGKDLGHELVDVVRGDEFVKTENLPPPRLVKIDVEGYEYAVLRGLQRTLAHPACELLCCEIHPQLLPPDVTPQTIMDFVQSIGYECLDLRPRFDTFHLLTRKAATCPPRN
ncbi:MAG: FkbM family methyltransferase [Candidatus Acidiferrales bacterium]